MKIRVLRVKLYNGSTTRIPMSFPMPNTPVSVLAVQKDPRRGLYQDLKVVVISLNLAIHQSGPRELLSGSLVLSPATPIVIAIVMSHHNITFNVQQ